MNDILSKIIVEIVKDNELHAKWLNTLSMMENTGAKKISASEHKIDVSLMVLKHAAEEARHAFYMKKLIGKLGLADVYKDYSPALLISPLASLQYLNRLDVELCRYLKNDLKKTGRDLVFGAYLLVTYGIELRAGELYPVYQEALSAAHSKVNVKSVIAEEETHLEEMLSQMKLFFGKDWEQIAGYAENIEKKYFEEWTTAIARQL
jgi:hypothetical protein